MADINTLLSATQTNNTDLTAAFRTHANSPRVETKTVILSLIRDWYPEYHVTEVDEKHASFLEYASAGHAKSTLDSDDESFMASRAWRAVGEGIEKKTHPGNLKDDFRFARYVHIPQP